MTYEDSGFDAFLSRSIDKSPQANLSVMGPRSTQIRYDDSQISGMLGDILQIGGIRLDGVNGRISIYDENGNEVVRLGELDD